MPVVTIRLHVDQWLRSKKTSVAAKTVTFYEGVCGKFMSYLGDGAEKEIGEVTRENVEVFRDDLAGRLAPKTVNHHVKVLRMVFRDACDHALLADAPTEFVKTVKSRKVLELRPFTMKEIRSVLEHCDAEWRSMVLFGLYTGQRLGDIARFQWKNIDLKRKSISLVSSKTDKELTIPLPKDLLNHLRALPRADQRIATDTPKFLCHRGSPRQNRASIQPVRGDFGEGGLEKGHHSQDHREGTQCQARNQQRETNGLSFHSLRRSTATYLHEAGVPQNVAMALIGHDSTDIHSIYVNVGEQALRKAAGKLPSL